MASESAASRSRFSFAGRTPAGANLGEAFRIERVICVARLFLALIALIALNLDPVEPAAYAPSIRILLVLFAAHSVAAVLVHRRRPRRARAFALATHAIDLVTASLTLPLAAPTNPFFAFFLFALASAAFRWGIIQTLATTVAAIGLVTLQQHFAAYVPVLAVDGYSQTGRLVARTAYLAMMGLMLGYLAEESRLLRSETAAVLRLLGKFSIDVSVTRALTLAANETVRIFRASHLLLVVEELNTKRIFRWDTVGGWSLASTTVQGESRPIDRSAFFFGPPNHSMAIVRYRWPWRATPYYETLALDPGGHFVDTTRIVVPEAFVEAYPFRRVILAPVEFAGEWSGRIYIFEPRLKAQLLELSTFLQALIRQVGPAVFSVYLQNRLQAKAGAMERARVARELHDGVIQSLIGVEMQLEVLRGQEPLRNTPPGAELLRVQNIVRDEVLNLRDLMQQMRPIEFDPDELLDHLADMVQRFGRDTGISARFISGLKTVTLDRNVCFELVRIVQEGLANIRRHSAATHAEVRLEAINGAWRLEIDDDGRGFPFTGRLTQAELDARRLGPTIIKERVRAIGGELVIGSTPGQGCRLEVLVPQEGRG